jgi:hypothetical protein
VQQIAVATAEGIADFGEDGDQLAAAVAAEPEADRIEDEAEHPREALQDDLAVIGQAVSAQQRADPRQQRRTIARPVVLWWKLSRLLRSTEKSGPFAAARSATGNWTKKTG